MGALSRWIRLACSILLAIQFGSASAQTQASSRAGLVVQYGDGRVVTYCVRFSEPSITGLDLLNRSGLQVVAEVGGLGAAMCSINGQGCAYPSQSCFCQCQGANCAYWNYFHLIDGAWRYSPLGASSHTITDGAIDGWAWGDKIAPPIFTIDQICSESANQRASETTPKPTIQPTNEPTIEPTSQRTSEPVTTPTVPTVEPTITPTVEPAVQPTVLPTVQSTNLPTTNLPAIQPSNPLTPQTDLGGYVVFAVVVVALGGWLIVSRLRREK